MDPRISRPLQQARPPAAKGVSAGPWDEADLRLTTGEPRRDLRENGFVVFGGDDFAVPSALTKSLDTLVRAYDQLPRDPYSQDANRYRCHQRFVLVPHPFTVIPTEISNYTQSIRLNSEDGGTIRKFAPLPDGLAENSFLRMLIRHDFMHSPFADVVSNNLTYDVGLHLIRLHPRADRSAKSSPDRLHKDGEWVTWIHLISRRNVRGGENLVTDNDKQVLARVTLEQRLDTIAVWDDMVYHHVSAVEVAEGQDEGHRDILLVDFTPMLPVTSYQTVMERGASAFRARLSERPRSN